MGSSRQFQPAHKLIMQRGFERPPIEVETVRGDAAADRRAYKQNVVDRNPWMKWYQLPIWPELRLSALRRDGARCRACGDRATVVDHIKPHGGDWQLFVSMSNLQSLCKPCHSRKSQYDGSRQTPRRRAAR